MAEIRKTETFAQWLDELRDLLREREFKSESSAWLPEMPEM